MTTLSVGATDYTIHSIADVSPHVPLTVAVLLESLIRHGAPEEQIEALRRWDPAGSEGEVEFHPARVIMQDFTGVPCMVDLAVLREGVEALGGDPSKVNPLIPVELVIDHSVIADEFGWRGAFARNRDLEFERNKERYQFLKWGRQAFDNLRVVPPDTGIVHQVNIEHLAHVIVARDGVAYPDTCIGTDSHTTMVNGLGVLGWGVGGIEAEAAMLGQPVSMTVPRVVGVELTGQLPAGATSTDLVLYIAEKLRSYGVVGKFIEFFGPSVTALSVETRCTIANMSPEYGSTACLFPIDERTIDYMRLTGRSEEQVALIEAYAKAQGLWLDVDKKVAYSQTMAINLAEATPSIAGPRRPQDRIVLTDAKTAFETDRAPGPRTVETSLGEIPTGAVAIAAITSCTNTSNPQVMVAAGLLAAKAVEKGLRVPDWVKTTMSPGSQVVTDYLDAAGLTEPLEKLGFFTVGYGCVTCIGNSGPVVPGVKEAVDKGLSTVAVLSGNRNFEGRISPDVRMNYLASPPLVVAYALAGTMDIDLATEPLGSGVDGPVCLSDIWPSDSLISETVAACLTPEMFRNRYEGESVGSPQWAGLEATPGLTYSWPESMYIRRAPYLDSMDAGPRPLADISGARVLLKLGDSVTTDHISPAGSIPIDTPAGKYLTAAGVEQKDFNSYGSRRGNHEVMVRGTFANVRLKNLMVPGVEGGFTRDFTKPDGPISTVFDAAQAYEAHSTPLVVLAGKEYGSGSSRDWAAKGAALLGVKAVIAQSFERIHRSNLVGMGILPLEFPAGQSADSLGLTGEEIVTICGLQSDALPRTVTVSAEGPQGHVDFVTTVRVDTLTEEAYLRNGGILPYVARMLAR